MRTSTWMNKTNSGSGTTYVSTVPIMTTAGRNFSVIHEKIVHCRLVCMCPTMDLIASLHDDGQLSVHRTLSWQRSFTLTLEDMGNRTFACMTWSPNGKTLAVGYTDGNVQLFAVETGFEECSLAFHEGKPLAALTWVAQQPRQGVARSREDDEADQLAELASAYTDRCEHVLGSSDRLPGGNGASSGGLGGRLSEGSSQADDGFALLQGMKERPVSVLASADASGVVVLSICGAYRLITVNLRSHRAVSSKGKGRGSSSGRLTPPKADSPRHRRFRRSSGHGASGSGAASLTESDGNGDVSGPGVRPLQLSLSADLSILSALVEVEGHIELIQVDLPLLWCRRHELKPLAMQFTSFRAVIGRLVAFVPRLPQLWKSALQALENKLGNLEELLPRFGYDSDITPRDELIHLVTCGFASDALTQFLSTGLTEVQLSRMRKAVDIGTGQVEAMLRGDLSFLARTLLFQACDLHRLAVVYNTKSGAKRDGDLGLGLAPVEAFLKDCEMLCVKVEQVLSEVQISRSRLRLLLVWLEQVAPTVTDSTASNGARNDDERHPPNLALANSILSILGEPLPSDGLSSNVKTPRSRVEAMIGTSVPGLSAVESSEDLPERSKGDQSTPWPACTIAEQVQRLKGSISEVFKAPRDKLSRAVENITCARLCVSSEGTAGDLVRTRAAAKAAAAAAAGGATPLVPIRTCMFFQDNLPSGCLDQDARTFRNSGGGIVVAAVAPDNARGGKGLDVVWVIVVPTAIPASASSIEEDDTATGGERSSVRVTGVRSPPGYQVRQVAFYGSVPGVSTHNEGRLAIVLEPMGDRNRACVLHLLTLDDLSFTAVGPLTSFDYEGVMSPSHKIRGGIGPKDVVGTARGEGLEPPLLSELSSRSRELPEHVKGVTVALSGARGIACAISSSKNLIVFDLEEDEVEEEEEGSEEGGD